MGRARSLAEQSATRELAVLVDGPWHPMWLWRDVLEARIASARRIAEVQAQPYELLSYHPAAEWVQHRTARTYAAGLALARRPA